MWKSLLKLKIRDRELLNEKLTKEQIYKKISMRINSNRVKNYGKIEKLYKTVLLYKFENGTVIDEKFADDTIENIEEIESFKRMMKEEEYIVKLINEKYRRKTSISNWRMNLHFLKGIYSELINDKSVDMKLVNSYIDGYSLVDSPKIKLKKKKESKIGVMTAYSPEKAVEYAITYAFNYNTDKYPDYSGHGGDCANFISQALHEGGKPMKGTNATNFNNWFCRSNHLWDVDKISSTWRGADAFGYYWKVNAVSYKNYDSSYFNDKGKFKKVLSFAHRGDAVSLLNANGRPYHTLIIIDYSRDDLILATHSRDTISASLRSYASFNGARIYKMYE